MYNIEWIVAYVAVAKLYLEVIYTDTEIYLDNGATTKVSQAAAKKVMQLLTEKYGNPSSLHSKGLEAQREVDRARSIIADKLDVTPQEIIFTSGGTESNNLAIIGAAESRKRIGNRIVVFAAEHSSVLYSCKYLESQGFDVQYIPADKNGVVNTTELENAVNEKTILVSLMLVNNETGAIQPVDKIERIINRKKAPAVYHCDAVQAFGKIPFTLAKLKADIITISAHKIHAPKGVGAVCLKKGVRISQRQFGGDQEKKLRAGTEPTPLIAAFGEAVAEFDYTAIEKIKQINLSLRQKLSKIDCIWFNSNEDCLPYVLNFSVVGIRSETMLHYLAAKGIYVSSGSACAKGLSSHVLKSMSLQKERIDSAIRVSFSKHSTLQEVQALALAIQSGIDTLVRADS
ncbi:cysteine desulfurase [Clostridia bacterium]|nr:cysteine desulfurase [Clostridia bacterium]